MYVQNGEGEFQNSMKSYMWLEAPKKYSIIVITVSGNLQLPSTVWIWVSTHSRLSWNHFGTAKESSAVVFYIVAWRW